MPIQLYEQEATRLLTVVVRILKNYPLAEDVVHDSFINIWKTAGTYNRE
ncbi:sigma factor [Psychromonas sp. L1A2]